MTVNKKIFIPLLYFLFILVAIPVMGQKSKVQLEKQKKQTLQKIREAERILKETEAEKTATMGQLNAINKQIENRETLITSINREISLLNSEIGEIGIILLSLEADLLNLKKEYAAMVYATSKSNQGLNKLTFLFSAQNFNQLWMRLKYMEQYTEARKDQVAQIEKVKEDLNRQRTSVESKRFEKRVLLEQQMSENNRLASLKEKQNNLVKELGKREIEIKSELAEEKKSIAELDNLIADLIKREMEKAEAAARAKSKSNSKSADASKNVDVAPETTLISNLFEDNKKRLNWPVSSGFISNKFGVHPHAVWKNYLQENPGIDIQTNKNETVRAVFDGKIKAVSPIPGMGYAVIVQHGEYYTVYSKLKKPLVHTGQDIKAKDPLGEVLTDKNGLSEVQFQVWKNNKKLNPEDWIVSK